MRCSYDRATRRLCKDAALHIWLGGAAARLLQDPLPDGLAGRLLAHIGSRGGLGAYACLLHDLVMRGVGVQEEDLPLQDQGIMLLSVKKNHEAVRLGGHGVHGMSISAEPRKDLLRDGCVDVAKTAEKALVIVGRATARIAVPLCVELIHGPVANLLEAGSALGSLNKGTRAVVEHAVHVRVVHKASTAPSATCHALLPCHE